MFKHKVLRICCIALATAATALFLVCLANYIIPALLKNHSPFLSFMSVLSITGIAGFFIGLFKVKCGAIMLFFSGLGLFLVFTVFSDNHPVSVALMIGAPFMGAGILTFMRHYKMKQ